jgi:hypothetical protein
MAGEGGGNWECRPQRAEYVRCRCTPRDVALDAFSPSPYLSAVMNRLLLTLLALLTGFAAQVSPAQATVRGGGEAEIASVQAVRAVRLGQQVAVRAAGQSVMDDAQLGETAAMARLDLTVLAVRIGIDRARE